jgi:hypothetical protein
LEYLEYAKRDAMVRAMEEITMTRRRYFDLSGDIYKFSSVKMNGE